MKNKKRAQVYIYMLMMLTRDRAETGFTHDVGMNGWMAPSESFKTSSLFAYD